MLPLTVQLVSVAVPSVEHAAAVDAAELPLTVQLVSVVVPTAVVHAAAVALAVLPLTVQLVSVVVPTCCSTPPPLPPELPLTVQLVSVAVPPLADAAADCAGGVAADGAVGQRRRAGEAVDQAAAA